MAIRKKSQQQPKAETETKQQSPKAPAAVKPSTKDQKVESKDQK